MTFNRETGVVVAIGNVVMLEPDGQVLFAQYAELSRDMSEGILKTVRAQLDQQRQDGGERHAAHRRPAE